jgi:phosphate transport system substrate-binding protein
MLILLIFSISFISCQSARERVRDTINLQNYQPFSNNTRAVKLPEPATLRLVENLPRISGATALYPLYASFVQAVYPVGEYPPFGFNPLVSASGTPNAYNSLIRGEVDLIFAAGPSNAQIETAKENGITFILTPIGKEAFVFFVNSRNRVTNLAIEQIIGIYSGRITNWRELGGRWGAIQAFQRPRNSGSQTMLESIMEDETIIEPITENVLDFMLSIIERTADYRNHRNAIGYSFLFFTTRMVQNNSIRLLSIDGVFPTIETIQNNEYPFVDYFYAITTNRENENVNNFIDWILSDQGQYIIAQTGYVPLR